MRNGGQIPWNAKSIGETFKISYLMGRPHMKDVLENHLKDQSFRLVHWLSITLSLRRTSQESNNLERKSYQEYSWDTLCTRGEFGRVTIMVADIEELETMDASESMQKKTQCKGSNISQRKWKIHFTSRRWTNQTFWRRSGIGNICFDTGSPNSRRRSKKFSPARPPLQGGSTETIGPRRTEHHRPRRIHHPAFQRSGLHLAGR